MELYELASFSRLPLPFKQSVKLPLPSLIFNVFKVSCTAGIRANMSVYDRNISNQSMINDPKFDKVLMSF